MRPTLRHFFVCFCMFITSRRKNNTKTVKWRCGSGAGGYPTLEFAILFFVVASGGGRFSPTERRTFATHTTNY